MQRDREARPWYREPWPWALMVAPAVAVVAGLATLVLAVRGGDAVVADDYYRRGLAINRVLERDRRARELGLAASVSFSGGRVRVVLARDVPGPVRFRLIHPTRAGSDQVVQLRDVAPRVYEGELEQADDERRLLVLEDLAGTWRLTGTRARHAGSAALDSKR
jgi:hypothetical protein